MQQWASALPVDTQDQRSQKAMLQTEVEWARNQLSGTAGIDAQQLVSGHCDLLHGNVIIQPSAHTQSNGTISKPPTSPFADSSASSPTSATSSSSTAPAPSNRDLRPVTVSFIDYEYATPSPVAFDIANHFAEWGGFECDFTVLPTRAQRRNFLSTYLQAYNSFRGRDFIPRELDQLMDEVDIFRGVPGLYWGIWGLVQAQISQIDFDYASYADTRLSEYFAWKSAGKTIGEKASLRERRWAQNT